MKTFSAPANPEASAREIARGCFTANLAIPGMGSLVGGRKVGYAQLLVCFTGFGLSLVTGVRCVYWVLAHWDELHDPNLIDPFAALREVFSQMRWPLLGIVLFIFAWLWALLTSYSLLRAASATPPTLKNQPADKK